jgi:hypothetical protein
VHFLCLPDFRGWKSRQLVNFTWAALMGLAPDANGSNCLKQIIYSVQTQHEFSTARELLAKRNPFAHWDCKCDDIPHPLSLFASTPGITLWRASQIPRKGNAPVVVLRIVCRIRP